MGNSIRITLLDNEAATGSALQWPGGDGWIIAEGTFDADSVNIQIKSPQGTWLDVLTGISGNGFHPFSAPAGLMQAEVEGPGTAASLYVYALRR